MNERFEELAAQAKLQLSMDPPNGWRVIAGTDAHLEKFGDLIVAECAKQVDWILADGGKTQGDLIRERFGIPSTL